MIPTLLLTATLSIGNAELDHTAALVAAELHLQRQALVPTGTLARTILQDPSAHQKAEPSRAIAYTTYTNTLARNLQREINLLRQTLKLPDALTPELPTQHRQKLLDDFQATYARERNLAIREQANHLIADIRPTETELETLDRDRLRRLMLERLLARQTQPLLEENRQALTRDHIEPILQSGYDALKRQHDSLRRFTLNAYAPDALKDEILRKLKQSIQQRNRNLPPTQAWGIFPSIHSVAIPQLVTNTLVDRLTYTLRRVEHTPEPDQLFELMLSDLETHRTTTNSWRALLQEAREPIRSNLTTQFIQSAPSAEQPALEAILPNLLAEPAFTNAFERNLADRYRAPFKEARTRFTQALARDALPTLFDRTWTPDLELADRIIADPKFNEVLTTWRTIDELKSFAEAEKSIPLPSESPALIDRTLRERFATARQAHTLQLKALKDSLPPIAGTYNISPQERLKRLTEATLTTYNATRIQALYPNEPRPENVKSHYAELFPSVLEQIRLIVNQYEQEPEPAPPQDNKIPQDPSPEEEEEEILSLAFKRSGNDLQIEIRRGQSTLQTITVPARARNFREGMREAIQTLSKKILNLPD